MVTHWAGCGASFSDPGFAGWCALAVPVVSSRGLYSFSMYEFLPNSGKPPTTATVTGLALLLREWQTKAQDSIGVYGIGAPAGVAVTSTATQFNPAWGGIGIFRRHTGWTVEAAGIKNQVTGKIDWKLGAGLTW